MIIFDLDGTLANCEHRRHFVDPNKEYEIKSQNFNMNDIRHEDLNSYGGVVLNKNVKSWKPDWNSFYQACDQDKPINPAIEILIVLWIKEGEELEIWSGRSESVRNKTEKWLNKNIFSFGIEICPLKMRSVGDSTPDDVLKEKWLDEVLSEGKTIDYVFDDRPKVIRMWRKKGIFVFNCCQHHHEF